MKRRYRISLRSLVTVLMMAAFAVFVFGQGSDLKNANGDPDIVRVIGWIGIIMAALTHTAMNIYNMVRGKNYEQLKEAMQNYKELAESRNVVIADLRAEVATIRQDMTRLEFENERLAEQRLRK